MGKIKQLVIESLGGASYKHAKAITVIMKDGEIVTDDGHESVCVKHKAVILKVHCPVCVITNMRISPSSRKVLSILATEIVEKNSIAS